ncbi:putative WD40-repeat-containing domain superfamily [Helianthus annuus]|nr:putative WD40-repeat-containing domain superfamily [Helianthus annuus]
MFLFLYSIRKKVACTSLRNNEVLIFDIGYASSEPTEVLRKRSAVSVHGSSVRLGLSDIALSNDDARVLASDTCGVISIWDRRASNRPQSGLTTNATYGLTSIQLDENQVYYIL